MLKQIYISTSFEGIHSWKDAPDEVKFLRDLHRHIFNVKIWFKVNHNDRDLEFFIMKKKVDNTLLDLYMGEFTDSLYEVGSCEMIAQDLLEYFDDVEITKIEVNEDGENGVEFIS